jgi:hypothetical protein
MEPARRSHISSQDTDVTISLQPGYYRFTVDGKRTEVAPLIVKLSTLVPCEATQPQTDIHKIAVKPVEFQCEFNALLRPKKNFVVPVNRPCLKIFMVFGFRYGSATSGG